MKETVRKRKLPEGWYPDTENGVINSIKSWESIKSQIDGNAVVVPHAGWYFSGKIASNTIKQISGETDIIVIAGGHLSEYDYVMAAEENYFETPLGNLKNSGALCEKLFDSAIVKSDRLADNTVEIQLPFVKYYFPDAEIIWLRMPPDFKKLRKYLKYSNHLKKKQAGKYLL